MDDPKSLPPVDIPPFHPVQVLRPSAPPLENVERAVASALRSLPFDLPAGAPVAVTAGSRGIDRIAEVIRAVCAELRRRGARPFVVPAMGSHAGATAEGQRAMLAEYGITEEGVGAPVVSSMETVSLGATAQGIEVFMDRAAWEAGRVLLVNRVKVHTDFSGAVESGLMKMLAIGLGKIDGARRFHVHALRLGFDTALLEMARFSLGRGRVLGGLALLENDRHRLCEVVAAPAAEMEATERRLLHRAREIRPRLPFSELDLLIVDEMGKDISGAGMDTRVIGRSIHPELEPAPPPGTTTVRRIFVRDLTAATEGNACGVGLADITHERLFRKVNFQVTFTNTITSLAYVAARLPLWFTSDRAAIEFALRNMGLPAPERLRAVRIRNTLALDAFLASPACARELAGQENFRVLDPVPLEFDEAGDIYTEVRELAGVA